MIRFVDIAASLLGLLIASPVLLPVMLLLWLQDRHSPFYIAPRVGIGGQIFKMIKLRSMRPNADATGVDSTSEGDTRITPLGHFVRRYKLDELTQLWNVFVGEMSLVGPRPNVERETRLYTDVEARLLTVRPGITDFASIVFADEGEILVGHEDADLAYNQLIRPWKSRLGLFYIEHRGVILNIRLVMITAMAIASRKTALLAVARVLEEAKAPIELIEISRRVSPLVPSPPPGAEEIVRSR